MITVHIIFHAHLDPIWLWPWPAGIDAALATCRSVCDRLDSHHDVYFSQGEAWFYDQIERIDPALFKRICTHIESGQWNLVGGWWIQPDCNMPSAFAMQKQIELGKSYFLDRFGTFPDVAFNVDSFGHASVLPTLMHEAGQRRYVMMRPDDNEIQSVNASTPLPARVFRWASAPGEPEVVTFHIAYAYLTREKDPTSHVQASLTRLPDGVEHTMCFMGVGDHGGGPTEEMIRWVREHADAFDGARLQFSTPDIFFDCVEKTNTTLELVTGELQHHAIGCYSVYRSVKVGVRRAEHSAAQAELAVASDPTPPDEAANMIRQAWHDVCFHHFHDTLGGTSIASAYEHVHNQLGRARAMCDDVILYSFRRQLQALPDDTLQRMVLYNCSNSTFDDFVEVEPWLDWRDWQDHWRLLDESGQVVPHQVIESECVVHNVVRLILPLTAAPEALRVLRIDDSGTSADAITTDLSADDSSIRNSLVSVHYKGQSPVMQIDDAHVWPGLHLIDDTTDTWSHGIDSYAQHPAEQATFAPPKNVDNGPVMASLLQEGTIGDSRLRAEWRVYRQAPFVELRLNVLWVEQFKILKLVIPIYTSPSRTDGVMGGKLCRPSPGPERPLHGWTCLNRGQKQSNHSTADQHSAIGVASASDTESVRMTRHMNRHNGTSALPDASDCKSDTARTGCAGRCNRFTVNRHRSWQCSMAGVYCRPAARTGCAGRKMGIVCPEVFALDATTEAIRLTLLRSPVIAHHAPQTPAYARQQFADQGEHSFVIRFYADSHASCEQLASYATCMQRPPIYADLTRGMTV